VPHRVLIVDDHDGFRAAARAVLEADGFEVVGEAADGAGAMAECERVEPAVVLLDVQLPDVDGFAVAERLSRGIRPPRVVLVSSRAAGTYRRRLAVAPVVGFLPKSEFSAATVTALLR
jgi:DNA-binding NarL/FixJ family response regulator